jgi:hypothetical protein
MLISVPSRRHGIMEMKRHYICNTDHRPFSFKPHRIGSILLMLLLAMVSFASSAASRIELLDGTVINGELLSMANGRYVIQSATLGRVELPQSKIRSIEPVAGNSAQGAGKPDFQSIQQQIVASPELMRLVTAMMSDPQIQAAINDPEFMRLVLSGDVDALKSDPRILKLMANPSMQAIIGKMQQR